MNFQFDLNLAVVVAAWAVVMPIGALGSILIAAFVFFSQSIPLCMLFLLSLNLISLIQATLGGKKSLSGLTQKRYLLVFFGNLCALMGSTLPNASAGYPLMFAGLLLGSSNIASDALFYVHFESLTLRSYLQSIVLPAVVAIDILLKLKADIRAEYADLWDITLLILGPASLVVSSLLALSKRRLEGLFIYLAQAWIGLMLFLLVVDAGPSTWSAFASAAIAAVTSVMLLQTGSKLGGRYFAFAKIAALGFPCSVVFAALFFTLKLTFAFNLIWLIVIGGAYLIQSVALIGARPGMTAPLFKTRLQFWLITCAQFISGVFLLGMDKGLLK